MNGAEGIVRSLEAGGIDVCFANPGTTELHLMVALERHSGIRPVLGLFEGVVTGAADGYARMAGKPAATLLHLGPGLANGLANLHNARRSGTPVVNLIGDHARDHIQYDAPLTSDIESLAGPVSGWVRTIATPESAAGDAAEAVEAAMTTPGQVASLIIPADVAWGTCVDVRIRNTPPPPRPGGIDESAVQSAREALSAGRGAVLVLGGAALHEDGLRHAGRIAATTGCDLLAQTSNPRMERGQGRTPIERIPYSLRHALERLAGYSEVVLVGATEPVAFFAYPDQPGRLLPPEARVVTLAHPGDDIPGALAWLAEELGAPMNAALPPPPAVPEAPSGAITPESIAAILGNVIPENAIISDESITTGRGFFPATHGAPPHTWLQLTGGAIGDGLPIATGAAIACPERKVISLQADGSGMYTLQALWTQAREGLDVTTLVFANRKYAILGGEMAAAGSLDPGPRSRDMVDLHRPEIDWVSLARGMGVDAERVENCESLLNAIRRGLSTEGPYLVEAVM